MDGLLFCACERELDASTVRMAVYSEEKVGRADCLRGAAPRDGRAFARADRSADTHLGGMGVISPGRRDGANWNRRAGLLLPEIVAVLSAPPRTTALRGGKYV